MTEENRRLWGGSVSRAYYAMFHLARALLYSLELESMTHTGMVGQLSLHLVRAGRFPAAQVRAFSQMQRMREDADYQAAVVFDEAGAREALNHMEAFRQATEACLG
ncbi:MAG: HEPN domain-containing protein [Vulcanimicrobiota bacterium]